MRTCTCFKTTSTTTHTLVLVTANNLHYAIHFYFIRLYVLSRLCIVLACSQHERSPITVFPFSIQNYTIHNRIMLNTKPNWFCLHSVWSPAQYSSWNCGILNEIFWTFTCFAIGFTPTFPFAQSSFYCELKIRIQQLIRWNWIRNRNSSWNSNLDVIYISNLQALRFEPCSIWNEAEWAPRSNYLFELNFKWKWERLKFPVHVLELINFKPFAQLLDLYKWFTLCVLSHRMRMINESLYLLWTLKANWSADDPIANSRVVAL